MQDRFTLLIFGGILLLLAANVLYLDITVFGKEAQEAGAGAAVSVRPEGLCTDSCQNDTGSISPTPTVTSATPTPTKVPSAPALPVSLAKEYYIPLGSGSTKSDTWEPMSGVAATIDTAAYPRIKQVTFEGYLRIPAGVGWMKVKLYNETDKHDVWGSELSAESDTSTYRSAHITLDSGNKTYSVRALSTINAEAHLDNARIKIITY